MCREIEERVPKIKRKHQRIKRRKTKRKGGTKTMSTAGDSAEEVVKLSLDGFEVVARLTGSMAKELAVMQLLVCIK